MSLFERAKKMIANAARSAAEEARMLRLQAQLGQMEEERERQYAEAGRRAHELYRAGRIHDQELGVILNRIDELDAAIEELRAQALGLGDELRKPERSSE